jgi:hypothetical protein
LPDFRIGQLAVLQISNKVREAAYSKTDTSTSMYVKIVREPDPQQKPRHFIVLSHAGIIKEKIAIGELRECGQDVDATLLHEQVEEADYMQPIPLLTAWQSELRSHLLPVPVLASMAATPAILLSVDIIS